MSAAQINSLAEQASTAILAGDYPSAAQKLRAAAALVLLMPDAGKGDQNMRWDRAQLLAMAADCDRQASAAALETGGIRRTKIRFVREDCP